MWQAQQPLCVQFPFHQPAIYDIQKASRPLHLEKWLSVDSQCSFNTVTCLVFFLARSGLKTRSGEVFWSACRMQQEENISWVNISKKYYNVIFKKNYQVMMQHVDAIYLFVLCVHLFDNLFFNCIKNGKFSCKRTFLTNCPLTVKLNEKKITRFEIQLL